MKTTIQLESKDVREMIALFLGIRTEDVIPNRYSYSVTGISAGEIEKKLNPGSEKEMG